LLYPDAGVGVPTERLVDVLEQVGLERLSSELDKVDLWSQRLSGGEQQRLALARVLLAEPTMIFLNEATASLDEPGEEMLYRLLRDLPWHPTVISVGHSRHAASIPRSRLRADADRSGRPGDERLNGGMAVRMPGASHRQSKHSNLA
jgi:vitamin B12/bleomycin/antimicrobial peptide transport system ATP-binding/permease protein